MNFTKNPLPTLLFVIVACSSQGDPAVEANAPVQQVVDSSLARSLLAELDPAIIQEVRYATSNNFTGAVLPGYGRGIVLLHREAAAALSRVNTRLNLTQHGLKVWDGYRPVRATEAMVAWTERVGRQDLIADGYIASRSRHNQGVAVDLTVVELAGGRELDMGTLYDIFGPEAHTANATGTVMANRRILLDAMEAEGFTNYANEWWHFSFEVSDPAPMDLPLDAW